jgi:hypothetical protein
LKEPDINVADRTCEYGNISHASFGDNTLEVVRPDHPEGLASIQAIALSERCSIVTSSTHSQRWLRVIECVESVGFGRRQNSHVKRVYVHEKHSGVRAIAWIQGIMCKVGKDLGQRWPVGNA